MSTDLLADEIRSLEAVKMNLGRTHDPIEQQAIEELEQAITLKRVMYEGRRRRREGQSATNR